MTYTLSVRTNDVSGFRAFTYRHHGPLAQCGYLFGARHELQLFLQDADYQILASSGGSPSLLRVSLDGRVARLILTTPDFRDGVLWPYERPAVQHYVDVPVSGEAVLRRTETGPLRYEVAVGMLHCAFAPLFEELRDGRGLPSALASFWPSLPPNADSLDYLFTPLGLALEGALDLRISGRRDVLLLPRHQPGATGGDAAWRAIPNAEKRGTHTWDQLDGPPKPNLPELVSRLSPDAPDPATWPVAEPRWAMLRWRLMTPERQPFIEHCFENGATGVVLERPASESSIGQPVHAELVCQLWVSVTGATTRLEHAGMVCSTTGTVMTAQFIWDASERNSVMTARTARSALWLAAAGIAAPAALFNVVRMTLRTATAPEKPAPNLALEWARDRQPSTAQLTLAPTGMLCGGTLAGAAGIAPPTGIDPKAEQAAWLMLEQGCLQLGRGTLPLDDEEARPAAELLAAAADSSQVFRGGLPLAALGGPPGLTAWVSGGADGSEPHAVLRIDRFTVELNCYDAILVWRTPGWWACATDSHLNSLRVPPICAPFIETLAAAPADRADADGKLGQALATLLFPALWVGRAGVAAPLGWSLEIDVGRKVGFVIPAASVRTTVLWSAFEEAYLVQTIPAGGQALGGPLLDPARGLVPLTHTIGEPLRLALGESGLPKLAVPRYPSPSQLASGWKPVGGELFHPNIAGLTLDPAAAKYTYRHGPPILADGYLRARIDGSAGSTLASRALGAARPSDDVGIDAIPLEPQATTIYSLHGWLPSPQAVSVTRLELTLGGPNPNISMLAMGGVDGDEMLKLRMGSRNDGFMEPVSIAAGVGNRYYLNQGGGKLLRNFGQSLAVDDDTRRFHDGTGRSWSMFGGGVRPVTNPGGAPDLRHPITQQRRGALGGGILGVVELSLCLADFDSAAPDRTASWDLSGPLQGHAGSAPMFGPFALLADSLGSIGISSAEVTARLAAPVGKAGLPATTSAGALLLRWQSSPRGWDLTLGSDRTFEWRFCAAPGSDASVASVSGSLVAEGTQLAVTIDRVSLHTVIGEIALPCRPAKLEYSFDEHICTELAVHVHVDGAAGLSADFVLQSRFPGDPDNGEGWRICAGLDHQPSLRWIGGEGELSLELGADKACALTFSGVHGWACALTTSQASLNCWLVLEEGASGVELAGSIERQEDGRDQPTQLRLAYRWTGLQDRLEEVFGPLATGSWARIEGAADWRSKGWGGGSVLPERTLSGHLILDNDYAFEFARTTGASETLVDAVHCYFDKVPLDANRVASGVLHAMVEHRFRSAATDAAAFSFQVPQAISVNKLRGEHTSMVANDVILLRSLGDDRQIPQVVPQILCDGDEALGACHGVATGPEQVAGLLIRLPLRTGIGRSVVKVPAPRMPSLIWFPLAAPKTSNKQTAAINWQERRALAHALAADTIKDLCVSRVAAEFAGGAALPSDGETLPEWGALESASGWLHSGLLDSGVGVRATPYYAGAVQADERLATEGSIPVTLYVSDPHSRGGLKRVATALVANAIRSKEVGAAEADSAVLLAWGAGEIVRRSLRTSAFVMAHGRPRLSGPVRRRFLVAAVDDATAAPPLVPSTAVPRHSALIELLHPSEGKPILPQVLTARTDQDSVLEVVDAQPLVAGSEPALRFRLALNHLVNDEGSSAPVSMSGASLSKRQRVVFANAPSAASVSPYMLPLVSPSPASREQVVSPPLVEVCTSAIRPGDTVYTRWAMRGEGAETGPGVEVGLRLARAGNAATGNATVELTITEAARSNVDGVKWALHEVTAARKLGRVPAPIVDLGIEVIVVTPRETAHRLVALDNDPVANRKLTLGVKVHQADDLDSTEASRDLSIRLLEPLYCGAFPHGDAGTFPAGSDVAWAVAAGDGARGSQDPLDPSQVSSLKEILESARTLEAWNTGERIRVVRLGQWQALAVQPSGASSMPDGYSLAPGADLARLLQATHKDRNEPRHWLLKEGLAAGPLLVLLVRSGAAYRSLFAFEIDWNRGAALEQPERVLAVRARKVLGFGDLGGPIRIRLEQESFMLHHTAFALDVVTPGDTRANAKAWLFGPSGACSAITGLDFDTVDRTPEAGRVATMGTNAVGP